MWSPAAVVDTMSQQTARKGFSIIELIVVVSIVGILSTLGIISYANFHNNSEAESAGQRVVAALASARQYAITTNALHQVTLVRSNQSFWIDELDAAGNVVRRQIENPGFLPQFIVFDAITVGGVDQTGDMITIRFWPDGHSETALIGLRRSADDASDTRNTATIRLFGPTGLARVSIGGA